MAERDSRPWKVKYDNDVGASDEGFWEWWSVIDADGRTICRCDDEDDAKMLVAMHAALAARQP
jgi:hypothetical protein